MPSHPNRRRRDNPAANPKPADIADARAKARLTQREAAALVYSTERGWQAWESGFRRMHPAIWELWQIKAGG